jgi:hypothetical protein
MAGLGLAERALVAEVSITYSVLAGDSAEATVTVNGLKTGDFVLAMRPADSSSAMIANSRVSAANTLAVTVFNWGGSTLSTTETLKVLCYRPERVAHPAEL